jgi:hypothetical protein
MNVCVIIPLYNKLGTIRRAVGSVRAQTCPPSGLVVVDDGSTDGSAAALTAWLRPGERLVQQPNGGVSLARNRGVAEVRSEWVAFLDADDEWHPDFLAAAARAVAAAPDVGVVFTNLRLSTSTQPWLASAPSGRLPDYFDFFVANRGHGMSSSSVVVRRDLLLRVGGFPAGLHHGEDLDVWTRLAWEASVAYVPEVLATYHVTGSPRAMEAGRAQVAAGLAHGIDLCREQLRVHRVPAPLCRSTRAYAQMLAVMQARELKDDQQPAAALRALRRAFPPPAGLRDWRLYTGALARCLTPRPLLQWQRRARAGRAEQESA